MKLNLPCNGLLLLFFIFHNQSFSQIDPATNANKDITDPNQALSVQYNSIGPNATTSLSCESNTFWAINGSGQIIKFNLNGNSVVQDSIITSGVPGNSLAICSNLTGGPTSPTFYTTGFSGNSVSYYDGNNTWSSFSQLSSYSISNSCGVNNNLYFITTSSLVKFDGTIFSTHYNFNGVINTAADISADNAGNIYLLTGSGSSAQTQFIDVISPAGILIKRYNLEFNSNHLYGNFILNNTLYLGLGSFNQVYPNTLVPVTFSPDSAFLGTPIPMPAGDWYDLASCNIGSMVSIKTSETVASSVFQIYPNPANEKISFTLKRSQDLQNAYVSICNIYGHSLLKEPILQLKTELDISNLEKGVYMIKFSNKEKEEVQKIIKE
ncbi:MAG: T9SS type A sorting domain-containing protein [Bacteroidota bacterium]|nr:T9SS type A sorting domain-containing protein [Bacteroidota bacterium]